jgi:hypothetical protein
MSEKIYDALCAVTDTMKDFVEYGMMLQQQTLEGGAIDDKAFCVALFTSSNGDAVRESLSTVNDTLDTFMHAWLEHVKAFRKELSKEVGKGLIKESIDE